MGKVALSYSEADKKGETLIEWPWHYWFIKQMHFNGKKNKTGESSASLAILSLRSLTESWMLFIVGESFV